MDEGDPQVAAQGPVRPVPRAHVEAPAARGGRPRAVRVRHLRVHLRGRGVEGVGLVPARVRLALHRPRRGPPREEREHPVPPGAVGLLAPPHAPADRDPGPKQHARALVPPPLPLPGLLHVLGALRPGVRAHPDADRPRAPRQGARPAEAPHAPAAQAGRRGHAPPEGGDHPPRAHVEVAAGRLQRDPHGPRAAPGRPGRRGRQRSQRQRAGKSGRRRRRGERRGRVEADQGAVR
mmetsp:Transcript_25004/g.60156  ORF Transcript_25004/g.60156 Transcript_25004/m.60156 type:complete len:235 (+) Transcript_25004:2063-2767(+)